MKKRYLAVGILSILVVVVGTIAIPWDILFPNQEDQEDQEDPDVRDYENYPIAENFWTRESYTGNVSEYDQFLEMVDNFDYAAELNMSLKDYPQTIANYCTSALFDQYAAIVQENIELWGGKPYHASSAEYEVHIEFLSSLNFTCLIENGNWASIYVDVNPEITSLNETHGSYMDRQERMEDPPWYFNTSYLLPNIFSYQIESNEVFPLESLIQFSDVYVTSMEMRYMWMTGHLTGEIHVIEQMVIFSADRDVMAIFVADLSLFRI